MLKVSREILGLGKDARMKAYLDAVTRANKEAFKEALQMYDPLVSLEKTFTELGYSSIWEAKGEARGRQEGEQKGRLEVIELLKSGKPPEEIIREYEARHGKTKKHPRRKAATSP